MFIKIADVLEDCPISNTMSIFFFLNRKPKEIRGIQTSEFCLGARIMFGGNKMSEDSTK